MTRTLYTTLADAIAQELVPALGEFEESFDVDRIADDLFAYDDGWNGAFYNLNWTGYFVRNDVDFWSVVQRHDRAGKVAKK